jgi:hypothetical protein
MVSQGRGKFDRFGQTLACLSLEGLRKPKIWPWKIWWKEDRRDRDEGEEWRTEDGRYVGGGRETSGGELLVSLLPSLVLEISFGWTLWQVAPCRGTRALLNIYNIFISVTRLKSYCYILSKVYGWGF